MWEVRGVFIPPHCAAAAAPVNWSRDHFQNYNTSITTSSTNIIAYRATMVALLFGINLSSGFVFYPNVRISVSERKRKTYSGGRKLKWTKFTLTLTTFKTFHSFSLFVPRGKWQSKKPDCAPHPCQHLVSCVMLARNNILTQKSRSVSAVHIFVGITWYWCSCASMN